jgi:hypothetical protein
VAGFENPVSLAFGIALCSGVTAAQVPERAASAHSASVAGWIDFSDGALVCDIAANIQNGLRSKILPLPIEQFYRDPGVM